MSSHGDNRFLSKRRAAINKISQASVENRLEFFYKRKGTQDAIIGANA